MFGKNPVTHFLLWVISLLLIGIILAACSGQGAPTPSGTPSALPLGKLSVGIDATSPPFAMFDQTTREFVGLDVELIKTIAAKAGLAVDFINAGYDQLITDVAQCQVDAAISAIAISDELKQSMNFSDSYYTTGYVVVVKKGNIVITDKDRLANMTVGVQARTPGEREIAKISQAQAKAYPTFQLAFETLISGYIDAVIADKPRAVSQVNIKSNNLMIVGNEFGTVNYGIAICKSQSDLTKKINDGLAVVKADGTLNRLMQKWLPVLK